jgi:hypothetical protein
MCRKMQFLFFPFCKVLAITKVQKYFLLSNLNKNGIGNKFVSRFLLLRKNGLFCHEQIAKVGENDLN